MDSEKHLILITRFSSGVTELCNIRTWKGFIKTIEFKFLLLRELPKIKPYHKKPWSDTPCNWQVSCSRDAQDANYLLPYEILKIAYLIYWLFFFPKEHIIFPFVQTYWASQNPVFLRLLLSVLRVFFLSNQRISVHLKRRKKWEICEESIILPQIHTQKILVYLLPIL